MAVEGIAHDWYISLKPLLIQSWDQIKIELLATFQGYQPETKTTPDLMNCVSHKLIISTGLRNGDILPNFDEWTHHAPPHIEWLDSSNQIKHLSMHYTFDIKFIFIQLYLEKL